MNPWRGLKNLPKEAWIIFTATLVNRTGTMVLPFLVLYLTESLNLTPARAGLILVFYGLAASLTAPLAGKLCDRIGSLKVMKCSLFLSGATLFIFPFARAFPTLAAVTIVWAILNEAFRPASAAIISEAVAADQRKAAFALSRLAINIGMSIGPPVGGFLARTSYLALFAVDGATSIAAGVALVVMRLPEHSGNENSETETHSDSGAGQSSFSALSDRRLLWFLALMIPIQIVFLQNEGAMPLFLTGDLGFSKSTLGMMLTINTILIILIEAPLNVAMARWPHKRAIALGALLTGAGFGALAFASSVWSAAATVVIWTFGEMILFPSSSAYIADIAPADRRGVYSGLYVMGFSLAFTIGPWMGLAALERFGARSLWIGAFVCGCISATMIMAMKTFDAKETRAAKM